MTSQKQSDALPLNLLASPLFVETLLPAAIVVNQVYLALMVLKNTVQQNLPLP